MERYSTQKICDRMYIHLHKEIMEKGGRQRLFTICNEWLIVAK